MRKDEMLKDNEFGRLLESLQARKGWTQDDAAAHLDFSIRTYSDWVTGKRLPSPEQLKHIAATFKLNQTEEDELYRTAARVGPQIHNPPFPPNPYFTGREDELEQLKEALDENHSEAFTQPVILSGLGGIGKTQIALAYAYSSFQRVYRTVLWVNAASEDTLQASYDDLARRLDLHEKEERDVHRRVEAVKAWFETHKNWLLIMDNADDLLLARSFFPTCQHGRILLATRSQFAGDIGAKLIEVDKMTSEDGLHFLLRRSYRKEDNITLETVTPDIRLTASQVVKLLDGHPLALDQAGAYLHERGGSFADYIALYAQKRQALLKRRRATHSAHDDHPESVVVTFQISFEQAAKQHPLATDILYFCAFLDPDVIPEELFQYDDQFKADPLALDEGIIALRRYSILKIHIENEAFSMHRLVQVVVSDGMLPEIRRQWRMRVMRTLQAILPEGDFAAWEQGRWLLPHALVCAQCDNRELPPTPELAQLLKKLGYHLRRRGQYTDAKLLLQRALSIFAQQLGAKALHTAETQHELAMLYWQHGEYDQAEELYKEASTTFALYPEAERSWLHTMNDLAVIYEGRGKHEQAEALQWQVYQLTEQKFGPEHLDTALSQHNLATIYFNHGKYPQAEELQRKALVIREELLGADHPDTATTMSNLGVSCFRQKKYDEAEALYRRTIKIRQDTLGLEHPETGIGLHNLAALYDEQGKDDLAEPLYQQAIAIKQKALDRNHPSIARSQYRLARLLARQEKYQAAEELYQQALDIQRQSLGLEHAQTQDTIRDYVVFLRSMGRHAEAATLEAQLPE